MIGRIVGELLGTMGAQPHRPRRAPRVYFDREAGGFVSEDAPAAPRVSPVCLPGENPRQNPNTPEWSPAEEARRLAVPPAAKS